MINLKFQCCFCNLGIEETNLDPLDISILGYKKLALGQRSSVDFFCHYNCVKNKLNPYFQGYMVEGIFEADDE